MEEASSGKAIGRQVARQGRRGGEGAATSGEGPEDSEAPVVSRERIGELSERLDGLIEAFRRRSIELGAVSGLTLTVLMVGLGISGGGTAYFWLAPAAFLAGMGIPWASGWWRLRKLPPAASEAPPSVDAELGALRERFDAFMPSPSELSATMLKFMAGMMVLMGLLSIVVVVGLWSVGEVSFAVGTMVVGAGFVTTSLPMYRFAKHYDRVGALGRDISALSRSASGWRSRTNSTSCARSGRSGSRPRRPRAAGAWRTPFSWARWKARAI